MAELPTPDEMRRYRYKKKLDRLGISHSPPKKTFSNRIADIFARLTSTSRVQRRVFKPSRDLKRVTQEIRETHTLPPKTDDSVEIDLLLGHDLSWYAVLQEHRGDIIRVATYNISWFSEVLRCVQAYDIHLICDASFRDDAVSLSERCPGVEVRLYKEMHSKFAVVGDTVYGGSLNFGKSGQHNTLMRIHDKKIARAFEAEWHRLWANSYTI